MQVAVGDLRLRRLDVIHGGAETFDLARGIRAVPLGCVVQDLAPLR